MLRAMWRWRVCSVASVLVACTDAGPAPSNTEFEVTARAGGTSLEVTATVMDLTVSPIDGYLDDATITATFRGHEVDVPFTPSGPYQYGVAIDAAGGVMADESITLELSRGDTTVTVANTMPGDFTLAQPPDAKIGDPVTVSWSPSSTDTMTWSGDCDATGFDGPVPTDTGTLVFPPAVFEAPQAGCMATLTMTRTRIAPPAGSFSTYFSAEQQHTVDFEIHP